MLRNWQRRIRNDLHYNVTSSMSTGICPKGKSRVIEVSGVCSGGTLRFENASSEDIISALGA